MVSFWVGLSELGCMVAGAGSPAEGDDENGEQAARISMRKKGVRFMVVFLDEAQVQGRFRGAG